VSAVYSFGGRWKSRRISRGSYLIGTTTANALRPYNRPNLGLTANRRITLKAHNWITGLCVIVAVLTCLSSLAFACSPAFFTFSDSGEPYRCTLEAESPSYCYYECTPA
jgi:hypothetical protein